MSVIFNLEREGESLLVCDTKYGFGLEVQAGRVRAIPNCRHDAPPMGYFCLDCNVFFQVTDEMALTSANREEELSYLETLITGYRIMGPLVLTLAAAELAKEIEEVRPR